VPVPYLRRLAASAPVAAVAAAVVWASGLVATGPAAAVPASTEPVVPAVATAPAAPAVPGGPAEAARRRSRIATRLAITVTPGRILTVAGVLSRRTGVRVPGRWIAVYVRTADRGSWRRARVLRTTPRGRVEYRIVARPDQQFTLRFPGDRTYGAAASAALVPAPSARALDPRAAGALAAARSAARKAGYSLVLNSGYRTWARQQRMYDAAVRTYGSAQAARKWVLPPAESTHVRGLALDVGTPAAAAWLSVRGVRWGLCRTYGDEPWHVEYRPDWIQAYGGRCPPTVPTPGDPDPLSPQPRVPVA
jgi:D-alanyl-D-alanine carboxypeptidase